MDPALKTFLEAMEKSLKDFIRGETSASIERHDELVRKLEAQATPASSTELAHDKDAVEHGIYDDSIPSPTAELVTVSSRTAARPAPVTNIIIVAPVACSTECRSSGANELTPASTPAAAPMTPTATINVIPVLTAAAGSDGTFDDEAIKGAASMITTSSSGSPHRGISASVCEFILSAPPSLFSAPTAPTSTKSLQLDTGQVALCSSSLPCVENIEVEVRCMVNIIPDDIGADQRPPWPPPDPKVLCSNHIHSLQLTNAIVEAHSSGYAPSFLKIYLVNAENQKTPCLCEVIPGAIPYGPAYFRWEIAWVLVVSSCADIGNASDLATTASTLDAYAKAWERPKDPSDLEYYLKAHYCHDVQLQTAMQDAPSGLEEMLICDEYAEDQPESQQLTKFSSEPSKGFSDCEGLPVCIHNIFVCWESDIVPPPYAYMSRCDNSKSRPIPWPSFADLSGGVHITEPRPPLEGTGGEFFSVVELHCFSYGLSWISPLHICLHYELDREESVISVRQTVDLEERFTSLGMSLNISEKFLKKTHTESIEVTVSDLIIGGASVFQQWRVPWISFLFLDLTRTEGYGLILFQWSTGWQLDEECSDYYQWHVALALPISSTSKDSECVLAGVSPPECSLGVQYCHGNIFEGCPSVYMAMVMLLYMNYSPLNSWSGYTALQCTTASVVQICKLMYGNKRLAWGIISDVFLKCNQYVCCVDALKPWSLLVRRVHICWLLLQEQVSKGVAVLDMQCLRYKILVHLADILEGCLSACYAPILLLYWNYGHLNSCAWYPALPCTIASHEDYASENLTSESNEVLIAFLVQDIYCYNTTALQSFRPVPVLELQESMNKLFAEETCQSRKVQRYRSFSDPDHCQDGIYFNVGHLSSPVVQHASQGASHCDGIAFYSNFPLSTAMRMEQSKGFSELIQWWANNQHVKIQWAPGGCMFARCSSGNGLVAWTVDGLEFFMCPG